MSHNLYQTEGFVLGSRNIGESSKLIDIYTKDFGLVRGKAQSIRELKSKLRYSLTMFSNVKVTLVRGREIWRIVGVCQKEEKFFVPEGIPTLSRAFYLLSRFCNGEIKDEEIFEEIESLISFLRVVNSGKDLLTSAEMVFALRVLWRLGYILPTTEIKMILENVGYDLEILEMARQKKALLVKTINMAIKGSQL